MAFKFEADTILGLKGEALKEYLSNAITSLQKSEDAWDTLANIKIVFAEAKQCISTDQHLDDILKPILQCAVNQVDGIYLIVSDGLVMEWLRIAKDNIPPKRRRQPTWFGVCMTAVVLKTTHVDAVNEILMCWIYIMDHWRSHFDPKLNRNVVNNSKLEYLHGEILNYTQD